MESSRIKPCPPEVQACQFAYFSLASVADRARQTLLTSVRSSENADIDRGVLQARRKKKTTVFGGAHSSHKRSSRSVIQREKVWPIDDYKPSLVNSAVSQVGKVTLHGVDHIACLGAALLPRSKTSPSDLRLMAKCWDLASAYKEIPFFRGNIC